MPSRSFSKLLPLKRKKMFSVKPLKMRKVDTIGNLVRDIPCPAPRSGHRIVYDNGNIYSFGGFDSTIVNDLVLHTLYKELLAFNCVSKTWQLLETTGNVPEEVASHCAVYFQNELYVFGGTAYPFGEKVSNTVHVCNLKTLHWSTVEASGCPPRPQYGQAVAVSGNTMFCVGGTSGIIYSNEVHCFDFITKEWKQLSKKDEDSKMYKLEPRYRHEIAIYDKKIFVFGGSSNVNFGLQELPVFNLQDSTWSKVTTSGSCPSPRRAHACVQSGSDVILMGGFNGDDNSYDSIYEINLESLNWRKLPVSLPYPLHFHSATLSDANQLYIFGGMNGEKNKRTNDIHSVWIKLPSLEAMCWEAVLHYVPQLPQLERRTLFEMGIPINYLNEVEHYSLPDSKSLSNNGPLEVCDTDASDDGEDAELPGDHDEVAEFVDLYDVEVIDDDSDWEDLEDQEAENDDHHEGEDLEAGSPELIDGHDDLDFVLEADNPELLEGNDD